MQTNLKRHWTEADVAELRRILRDLQDMSVGVHPGILAYDQYQAALATLIWFGSEMTGKLDFGREKHSISEGYKAPENARLTP